jgi:hypothetical protein
VPEVHALLAGQTIDAGTVTLTSDGSMLQVTYTTTGGWVLAQTHLAVGSELDEIPQTRSGNPKVGHFPYKETHDPPVTTFTYLVDLSEWGLQPGDVLYVAAHAEVLLPDEEGWQEETAWGEGEPFPGHNWAMYMTYVIPDSDEGGGGEDEGGGGGGGEAE